MLMNPLPPAAPSVSLTPHPPPTKGTRQTPIGAQRLGDLLVEEYRENAATSRPQQEGEIGHLSACWSHEVTQRDVESIREGGFPVTVIHGRFDLLAMPRYAERLAERLGARMLFVDGGHFVPRECAAEVSQQLVSTVLSCSLRRHCQSCALPLPLDAPASSPERAALSSSPSGPAMPASCTSQAAAAGLPSNSDEGLGHNPQLKLSSSSSQMSWLSSPAPSASGPLRCQASGLLERARSLMTRLRT
jgi:hypothetical protein